jgi:hypothetical protein
MPNENGKNGQPPPVAPTGLWGRIELVNQKFAYFIGLPIVTLVGSLLAAHFQYVAAYEGKVQTISKDQLSAAESAFTDVSSAFSNAITLQQTLYFNFHAAAANGRANDPQALEAQNSRTNFPHYEDARISLRENVDLLARRVELNIDWASDIDRDAANAGDYGADPMSRIVLGQYDFDCDATKYMPSFKYDRSKVEVPVPPDVHKEKPSLKPLGIDWYSAKHELLTMYYCFERNHDRILAAREWSVGNTPSHPKMSDEEIHESLDREAVRLHAFLTLAARRIEKIRVKFRPAVWYCHFPGVRELYDAVSNKCSPIRTADTRYAQ